MGKKKHYKSMAAYRTYGKQIYAYCLKRLRRKALADEAEQEVFTRLIAKGPDFQPPTTLIAWLREAARIVCLEILRRERRRREYEKFIAPLLSESYLPDHNLEDREAAARILASLSEEERKLLTLRAMDKKGWEQIGQKIGLSAEAARKYFDRICDRLRHDFPDCG